MIAITTDLSQLYPRPRQALGGTSKTYRFAAPGKEPPLFPFGFGLSYAAFEYSALRVAPAAPRVCDDITVTVTLANRGAVDADEVVQVYASNWAALPDEEKVQHGGLGGAALPRSVPQRQLVAFERVRVPAGAAVDVALVIGRAQLAVAEGAAAVASADGLPRWVARPLALALAVGGQQPDQETMVPSNVLVAPLNVSGTAMLLEECA